MTVLAIDTSTEYAYLAIRALAGEDFLIQIESPNSHIEALSDHCAELLQRAQLDPSEITQIVLGQGPGSFTGLRIGYSFAVGLATANQVPIYQYSSLMALVDLETTGVHNLSVLDARRSEFFVGYYQKREQGLVPMQPDSIMSKIELEQFIGQLSEKIEEGKLCCFSNLSTVPGWSAPVCPSSNLAGTLLDYHLSKQLQPKSYNPEDLSVLHPNYLRQVAALKLSERS